MGKLGADLGAPQAPASDAQADILQALLALGYSDKEAAAVVLGLLSGLPHGLPDGSAESALAKVNRVLPQPVADQVTALRDTLTRPPPSGVPTPPPPLLAHDPATAARLPCRAPNSHLSYLPDPPPPRPTRQPPLLSPRRSPPP